MESNTATLCVMLTYNDMTVANAAEIFDACQNSKAQFWGFKEEPICLPEMKAIYKTMKACGKQTVLEVVCYDEESSLAGAKMAVECGCDYLMGTVFFDSVNEYCKENNMKYCPFVGKLSGRPTVLEGDIDKMIAEAKEYLAKGAYGIDLLGYRFTGNTSKLVERFVSEVDAPVCVAGSVDSFERLDELKKVNPWSFTIGGAFFDKKFGDDFAKQIDLVCDYMKKA